MDNKIALHHWLVSVRNQTVPCDILHAIAQAFNEGFAQYYTEVVLSVLRCYIRTKDVNAVHREVNKYIDMLRPMC